MSNLVRFGSYTREAVDREKSQSQRQNYWKAKEGRSRIRFLPPAEGQDSPIALIRQHAVDVAGRQWPVRFKCLEHNCPACVRADELYRSGSNADREAGKKLSAKLRYFTVLIDRKEPERGPQVWEFGQTVFDQLASLRTNDDAGGDFTHPLTGFDIFIDRKGTGKEDTRYTVAPARSNSRLAESDDQINEWLENRPDPSKVTRIKTVDEVRALLAGEGEEDDNEAGATRAQPVKARALPAASRGPRPTSRRTAEDDAMTDMETEE